MRVPPAWIVFLVVPVVLLFFAIPFFKLRTLMPRERYRYLDLVAMIVATVAAAGLGATVPFVRAPTSAGDPTLNRFHDEIERHLATQTGAILDLATRILEHPASIGPLRDCAVSGSGIRDAAGKENPEIKQCGLWHALGVAKAPFELDVVLWFDEQGEQIRKWTTKAQITGPASHRPFDHFRDVVSGRLWTLKSATAADTSTLHDRSAACTDHLGARRRLRDAGASRRQGEANLPRAQCETRVAHQSDRAARLRVRHRRAQRPRVVPFRGRPEPRRELLRRGRGPASRSANARARRGWHDGWAITTAARIAFGCSLCRRWSTPHG